MTKTIKGPVPVPVENYINSVVDAAKDKENAVSNVKELWKRWMKVSYREGHTYIGKRTTRRPVAIPDPQRQVYTTIQKARGKIK